MRSPFQIFRHSALLLQKLVAYDPILPIVESRLSRESDGVPPIFIVGAPRTGSTLLYQMMVSQFQCTYLTNLHLLFYRTPLLVSYVLKKCFGERALQRSVDLDSHFGYVRGLRAPSEGGAVLEEWFGRDDRTLDQMSDQKMHRVNETVATISSLFGGVPFISKNLQNSLRIQTILQVFPKARIIWVKRDPLYTCQSIYRMREQLNGDVQRWASVKPFDYESLRDRSPIEQIVGQVRGIEEYISSQARKMDPERFCSVDYRDLCQYPGRSLEILQERFDDLSSVTKPGNRPLEPQMPKDEQKINDDLWQEFKRHLQ